MRIAPPDGGRSIFDYQPDLFAAFNRLYGTLWTDGSLEQPVKETARIRNDAASSTAVSEGAFASQVRSSRASTRQRSTTSRTPDEVRSPPASTASRRPDDRRHRDRPDRSPRRAPNRASSTSSPRGRSSSRGHDRACVGLLQGRDRMGSAGGDADARGADADAGPSSS